MAGVMKALMTLAGPKFTPVHRPTAYDHGDDQVAAPLRNRSALLRASQSRDTSDQHRRSHADHAKDQQRAAAHTVDKDEASDGIAQKECQARGQRGEKAADAQSGEGAAKGNHCIDPRHDLKELYTASEQYHIPEVGIQEDLSPRGAANPLLLL